MPKDRNVRKRKKVFALKKFFDFFPQPSNTFTLPSIYVDSLIFNWTQCFGLDFTSTAVILLTIHLILNMSSFCFNSFVGVFRSSSLFFLGLSRVNKSILSSIFSNRLLVIVCFFLNRWRFNFVWPLYYKSGYTLFTVVTTIQVGERTNNDDEDWKRERKYRPATNCLDPTPKNQIQLFGLHWVLLFVTSVSSFTFLRLQLKIPNWVKQFI